MFHTGWNAEPLIGLDLIVSVLIGLVLIGLELTLGFLHFWNPKELLSTLRHFLRPFRVNAY